MGSDDTTMRAHMNLLVNRVLRRLEHDLIDVAPAPVFAWLEGLDDRVIGRMEVFGGVLCFFEESQQPTCPQMRHSRRCTQVSPIFQALLTTLCALVSPV